MERSISPCPIAQAEPAKGLGSTWSLAGASGQIPLCKLMGRSLGRLCHACYQGPELVSFPLFHSPCSVLLPWDAQAPARGCGTGRRSGNTLLMWVTEGVCLAFALMPLNACLPHARHLGVKLDQYLALSGMGTGSLGWTLPSTSALDPTPQRSYRVGVAGGDSQGGTFPGVPGFLELFSRGNSLCRSRAEQALSWMTLV